MAPTIRSSNKEPLINDQNEINIKRGLLQMKTLSCWNNAYNINGNEV